jgi:DNA-binding LacI/PurR family transcriptional regulator
MMTDIEQKALALVNETLKNMDVVMERLEAFRAALEARGLEIWEKGQ